MINSRVLFAVIFMLSFSSFKLQEANYKLDGTWIREDGKPRRLYAIPGGLKMQTEEETYIYYSKGDNLYQMNWTPGKNGTKYRWTIKAQSLTLIENTYENDTYSGTIKYTYTKVLN